MSQFPAPSEGGGCVASRVVSLCARCELRELACARAIVHRLAAGCFSECARGRSSEGLEASALRAARFCISSESNVGAVPIARRVGAAAKEGPPLRPIIGSAGLSPRQDRPPRSHVERLRSRRHRTRKAQCLHGPSVPAQLRIFDAVIRHPLTLKGWASIGPYALVLARGWRRFAVLREDKTNETKARKYFN